MNQQQMQAHQMQMNEAMNRQQIGSNMRDKLQMLENNMAQMPVHSIVSFSSITQTDADNDRATIDGNQGGHGLGNKSVPNFNKFGSLSLANFN